MRLHAFVRGVVAAVCVAAFLPAAVSPAADEKPRDPAKIFARKDADKNGSLSLDEFKAGMKEPGLSKADARFKKIDTDGNGKLSLDEFKAGVQRKKS